MGKKRVQKKAGAKPKQVLVENPVFRDILTWISGEHGYAVAKVLMEKEFTDDELAKETGIRVNLVRRILYDFYENRIVSYRRVRDESSGWYVYYWRIEPERALEYFNNNKRLLLQKLGERLEYERNSMFFCCESGCSKLPFEQAAENDFKCPKCGGKLELYDNTTVVTAIERQIESLRQHLVGS